MFIAPFLVDGGVILLMAKLLGLEEYGYGGEMNVMGYIYDCIRAPVDWFKNVGHGLGVGVVRV